LSSIELPVPPLPIQKRIAGILSAYDELIENNQQRIRILEDMARSLYREWFIHFRYPGSEPSPKPSPNGLVIGWRQRVTSRARVRMAIEDALDEGLPLPYGKDDYERKCAAVFEHIYESYQGDGRSVFSEAA